MIKKLGILIIMFILYGRFEYNPKTPPPPPPPDVKIPYEEPKYLSKGSLYREGRMAIDYSDLRARHVGDIVTIKIVETYESSNIVKQQSAKSSSVDAGIENLFGLEKRRIEDIFKDATPSHFLKGGIETSTSGQGQTSRKSKIIATMTARVIKVLPNGNLVIQGTKTVKRNKDLEYITLTGIIRPEDIAYDNSILSTQISDVYIEYSGKGPSTEAISGPGILTRLLHILWIF